MIARVWKCIATPDNVPRYVEHFQKSVLPDLKALKGFQNAYILQQTLDGDIEVTVMTLWESMEAIRSFAGDTVETAVVEPAAQAVLKSFDKTVTHYTILVDTAQDVG